MQGKITMSLIHGGGYIGLLVTDKLQTQERLTRKICNSS